MPQFVPLKMFSFDNSFDSIHRSDKRAKQVELQQRPISLFKESFEQREGEYSGRDKNENFLSPLSFIDPAKRSGKTQVKGNANISFFHFLYFYVWDKHQPLNSPPLAASLAISFRNHTLPATISPFSRNLMNVLILKNSVFLETGDGGVIFSSR